jgi:hypothetical protein
MYTINQERANNKVIPSSYTMLSAKETANPLLATVRI